MANEFKHKSVGTELTQTEFEAVGGHVFDSQATGDIPYASSSTQLTRLPKGSANQILHMGGSNIPEWSSTLTATTIDATTDFTIGTTVITDDVITFTPTASDTVTMTAAANGAFSLVTVDAAAAAANIQITADGTVDIDSAGVLTLDSGAAINIEPATGSAILLDGTISIDAGVVTGATSITSTAFVGDITGDVTGTASTATVATSVTASANNSTDETVYPAFVDGATGTQGIETDTGLTYNPSTGVLTSTTFTGNLTGDVTGNADTATSLSGSLSNVTATGWFRGDDGVLAAPEFSFTSDTDTGIYRASEDHLSLSAGGQSITISEAVVTSGSVHYMGIYPTNTADGTGADGTTGKPFINLGTYPDTSSGWNFQPFNGLIGYYHFAGDGTNSYPSFSFISDSNTGFYRIASGHVGYSDDSILRVNFGGHTRTTTDSSGASDRSLEMSVQGTFGASGACYLDKCHPWTSGYSDLGTSTRLWDDIYTAAGDISSSDIRLKENIKPTALGLDFINDLNPVSYKWIDKRKGDKPDQTHYGIIAQEVIETLKDHGIDSIMDFGGIHGKEETYYGSRYQEFIPILMKAVQELSAEIKELKEKN